MPMSCLLKCVKTNVEKRKRTELTQLSCTAQKVVQSLINKKVLFYQ